MHYKTLLWAPSIDGVPRDIYFAYRSEVPAWRAVVRFHVITCEGEFVDDLRYLQVMMYGDE